jgi:aryl-alcohol dehydrogenase-like predicted oxidoreductase
MDMGLGTVQFGLDYGVSNHCGKTKQNEVFEILDEAKKSNIVYLDTAAFYGDSETVLGNYPSIKQFKIVTKINPIKKTHIRSEDVNIIRECFKRSLERLHLKTVYGILIHHTADLIANGGEKIFEFLQSMKSKGLVKKIGISIYPEDNLDLLLSRLEFDLIQLPLNVLDQRLLNNGTLEKCKKKGMEIHVRSAFLQGLLLMNIEQIPAYFNPIRKSIKAFNEACKSQDISNIDGVYGFIRSIPYIDVVLIGVNNKDQLKANIESWNRIAKAGFSDIDYSVFSIEQKEFINPSLWRL